MDKYILNSLVSMSSDVHKLRNCLELSLCIYLAIVLSLTDNSGYKYICIRQRA